MQGVAARYPEGRMKGHGVPPVTGGVCAILGEARIWLDSRELVTMLMVGTAFTTGTQPALDQRLAPATTRQQSGQAGGPGAQEGWSWVGPEPTLGWAKPDLEDNPGHASPV